MTDRPMYETHDRQTMSNYVMTERPYNTHDRQTKVCL